ncbi:MAG: YidH family protein [Nocardioidaceae bacterium]
MNADRAASEQDAPDPRYSLANERTLLSWFRMSLSFIVFGLGAASVQHIYGISDIGRLVTVAGIASILLGGLLAYGAYRRWRSVRDAIDAGVPLPPTSLVAAVTVGMLAVAAAALAAALVQLLVH